MPKNQSKALTRRAEHFFKDAHKITLSLTAYIVFSLATLLLESSALDIEARNLWLQVIRIHFDKNKGWSYEFETGLDIIIAIVQKV